MQWLVAKYGCRGVTVAWGSRHHRERRLDEKNTPQHPMCRRLREPLREPSASTEGDFNFLWRVLLGSHSQKKSGLQGTFWGAEIRCFGELPVGK